MHSRMSKRVLFAVMGFFAVGFSVSAQETPVLNENGPVRFTLNQASADGAVEAYPTQGQARLFGTLNSAWYGPGALTLGDGRLFSFPSAFAWMEAAPAEIIPAATLAAAPTVIRAAALAAPSVGQPVDLLPRFDYASSEVGVFYGKSTGKYGREVKAGYILSEIVEGNTHISVGMSYQESSGRTPRLLGR